MAHETVHRAILTGRWAALDRCVNFLSVMNLLKMRLPKVVCKKRLKKTPSGASMIMVVLIVLKSVEEKY